MCSHSQPTAPDTLWTRMYGSEDTEGCYSVCQTEDGGFILGGDTYSYQSAGGSDMSLVKTDGEGNPIWLRAIGSTNHDACESVIQTPDGGYSLGGWTFSFGAGMSDMYLVKTDSLGNVEWQQTYGGWSWDVCNSHQMTSDGGYILGGHTESFGSGWQDMYLVKTDSSGNLQWQWTYGGNGLDGCYSVQQTADGGFILGGALSTYSSGYQMWLVKTDSLGNIIWDGTYGYAGSARCLCVRETSDQGYILGGRDDLNGPGNSDIYIVKTDHSGNHQWQQIYGGEFTDKCYSILEHDDGGYIMGGLSNGHMYIMKMDSLGEYEWDLVLGGFNDDVNCHSLGATEDGGFIAGGYYSLGGPFDDDMYLVRLAGDPPPWVTLSPINPPVQIPANGGSFQFDITVANQNAAPTTVDVWTMVTLPDSSLYGPVLLRQNIPLGTGQSISRTLTQNVPANASAGTYYYKALVGSYLFGTVSGYDWFGFEKSAGGLYASDDDWIVSGWDEGKGEASVDRRTGSLAPTEFALIGAFPNPFNPTTTISFDLTVASQVKLDVFDINGRNVGARRAVPSQGVGFGESDLLPGTHQISFDGSGLASGIYIYLLQVSGSGATPTMGYGKMVMMK